jgi:hypothetical protein
MQVTANASAVTASTVDTQLIQGVANASAISASLAVIADTAYPTATLYIIDTGYGYCIRYHHI